ncbi:hypothetical protein D3248_11695 [Leucobacter zeae]|nr:hypothetical protein [Leucobacter zeae]
MTDTTTPPNPEQRLRTDAELHEFLGSMLEDAARRQFWTFYLGPDSRVCGPVMPMSDHPERPDELAETEDLGTVTFAEVMADRVSWIADAVGAGSVVFVWERPGSERFGAYELDFARALAHECGASGVRVRAQFLLHDTGVRQITPDDYA